jgi:hypothetical protein
VDDVSEADRRILTKLPAKVAAQIGTAEEGLDEALVLLEQPEVQRCC